MKKIVLIILLLHSVFAICFGQYPPICTPNELATSASSCTGSDAAMCIYQHQYWDYMEDGGHSMFSNPYTGGNSNIYTWRRYGTVLSADLLYNVPYDNEIHGDFIRKVISTTGIIIDQPFGGDYYPAYEINYPPDDNDPDTKEFIEFILGDCYTDGSPYFTARIGEDEDVKQISIFPNPSSDGQFNIKLTTSDAATIEIYNTSGQKIRVISNYAFDDVVLDLSNENAGIYIVKVIQNESISSHKIIYNN